MAWCNVLRSTSTKCFLYSSMLESLKFSMCLLGGPKNMMLTSKRDVGPYVVYDWNLRNHSMMKSVLLVIGMHIKIVSRYIVILLLTEFEATFRHTPEMNSSLELLDLNNSWQNAFCQQIKISLYIFCLLFNFFFFKQLSCTCKFLLPAMLITIFHEILSKQTPSQNHDVNAS